ncbi:uncharacterized protein LOC108674655 [Hyalella azteca]|uniref:Uncharacterized protein LOC108674655 n=1 Tax=Hyalella azteca TaxID=294128 RepID=A0A8B7NWE0_HYAAZ|nr:uncharacterized protein LOC108674655 [Hyalella azteca]
MLRVAAVTLSLLATLTSAEIYGGLFSACPGGAGVTDPYVMTQQFWNDLTANPASGLLIAYDGTSEDDKMRCQSVNLFVDYRNITLQLVGKNATGGQVSYGGKGVSSSIDGVFQLNRVTQPPLTPFPAYVLGSSSTGSTSVYLAYVSPTEFIIRTCRGVFMNTLHSLYVFTSQLGKLQNLNSTTCLLNTVKSLPNNGGFNLKLANWTVCGA